MSSTESVLRPAVLVRVFSLVLITTTFAYSARALATPLRNTDTYFHLRLGREFLGGWSAREPGSVSRFGTGEWLPTQWLGQVGYAFFEQQFGLAGVTWLSAAVVLTFALVLTLAARHQGGLLVAALIVPVALIACWPALSGRPQVISYICTTLVTTAWLDTRRTGRVAWWIIPMTWIWAMTHGMWPVSVLVSTIAVLGIAAQRDVARQSLLKMLLVPLLSLAVAALTPVGPGLYGSVVRVGSISNYFAEWSPPDFTQPTTALAALMMVLLLCLALRSGPVPWGRLALILLTGAWLLHSVRTVPVAVAMLVPLLALEIGLRVPRRPSARGERSIILGTFFTSVAVLAFVVPHTSAAPLWSDNKAHASVADLPPGTGLLNHWGNGGYDMWRHPQLDIVMHGYGDMFTTDEIQRNYDIEGLEVGWSEELSSLDVRDALLPTDSQLAYTLVAVLGWEELVEDDGLVHLRAPAGSEPS